MVGAPQATGQRKPWRPQSYETFLLNQDQGQSCFWHSFRDGRCDVYGLSGHCIAVCSTIPITRSASLPAACSTVSAPGNSMRCACRSRGEWQRASRSFKRAHDQVAARLVCAIKIIERIEKEPASGARTKQSAFVLQTVEVQPAEVATSQLGGCVGLDLNDRHLAWAVIDRFGNPVDKRTIPMDLRRLSATKRLSLVRQASAVVIPLCRNLHVPSAHEKLDFTKKTLKDNGKKQKHAVTPDADGAARSSHRFGLPAPAVSSRAL